MSKGKEAAQPTEGASMEQVRELLFGAQLKEMETRLHRQSEKFQRDLSDAKDTFKQRLDSLENFMKSENASLLHRLNAEKTERETAAKSAKRDSDEALRTESRERSEALSQIAKDLASAVEAFERKLTGLSQNLDNVERDLRQLLLTESGNLSSQLEERYQQGLDVIRKTSEEIRHDMVFRSTLAALFTETAVKLNGQWTTDLTASYGDEEAGDA